jgi:hypothetical protein
MSRSSFEAQDADEANVLRRLSSLVLSVGLVAACIGDAALALQLTVLNSGRVRSSAGAVLSAGPARRAMVRRVAAEITRRAPAASVLSPKQLDQVASAAVRDPRFVTAFGDALVAVHKHTFNGARDPVVLTPEPVTAAVRDAMAASAPELGPALPPSSELTVDIDASSVPDLEVVGRGINAATAVGLSLFFASTVIGIAGAIRRRRAVARVARWAVGIGISNVVALWFVPRFMLAAFGPWPDVAAAFLRATAMPLVLASALMAAAGGATLSLVHRLDASAGRRARTAAMADLARRTSWRPPALERTPRRRPSP